MILVKKLNMNVECLPVELIGYILSRIGPVRAVIIASTTCRKWREAYQKHLYALSLNSHDWPVYLTTSRREILMTQTLFQTSGLQSLSIMMGSVEEFSASTVMAWLMYTKETLRTLVCDVRTTPSIDILEIYGWPRLEALHLSHHTITGVEPNYCQFPCLTTLCLRYVDISFSDLNLLLTTCPKIENLALVELGIEASDQEGTVEITSPTLRRLYVEEILLDKFIVEVDTLEFLHLKACDLQGFELIGKGALKYFKIEDVSVIDYDVSKAVDNLETLDIKNFTIIWSKFYQMFSRSSKLKWLRLWDLQFDEEGKIGDMEKIAICFPQLSYLAVSYDIRFHFNNVAPDYDIQGSSLMENVIILELGWTILTNYFTDLIASLLRRCPNLKKLVIHGVMSEAKSQNQCQMLANFTSSLFQLMKNYIHVDVNFVYK